MQESPATLEAFLEAEKDELQEKYKDTGKNIGIVKDSAESSSNTNIAIGKNSDCNNNSSSDSSAENISAENISVENMNKFVEIQFKKWNWE